MMTTLRGISWDHPRGVSPLRAAETMIESELNVRVTWEARSLKDFGDAPLAELARDFDLLVIDHPHTGIAAAGGAVRALDELLSATVLEDLAANSVGPSFESYRYAGRVWALPIDAACQVGAARIDLLGKEPWPQTWEETFALAERVRARGLWVGMALGATDVACSFLTLCAQAGATWVAGAPPVATMATVLERLDRMAELFHPASRTWNPIRLYDHMTTVDDVVWSPLAFGYTNYARAGVARRLRFGSIPGRVHALLGGAGLAVSASCTYPEEAARVAGWLCGAAYQAGVYVEHGGQPAHRSAWMSVAANALTGEFFSSTRDSIERAFVRPRHAAWPAFQEEVGRRISRWLTAEHRSDPSVPAGEIAELHERVLAQEVGP